MGIFNILYDDKILNNNIIPYNIKNIIITNKTIFNINGIFKNKTIFNSNRKFNKNRIYNNNYNIY